MESKNVGAQKYFDKVPTQWDALYSHENGIKYAINKLLRKGLFLRYDLAFKYCGDLSGKQVLDVGCGTGRFAVECAKRNAEKVVGIDFAQSMIDFTQQVVDQMGISDKCELICGDFLSHDFKESFDVVLMMGLFDYIKEPEPIFKKVAAMSPKVFTASFPKFSLLWGIQRKIRYEWIRKCPIYYYTRKQLEKLYSEAPFAHYKIFETHTGILVAAGSEPLDS